jgi:dienelactone hydrolase
MPRLALVFAVLCAVPTFAAVVAKPVAWELGKTKFEGTLVYDDAVKTPRPGLVAVPNWMGVTPANIKQVEGLAGDRYVILLADVYGKDVRPKNMDEAGKAAGALKADRKTLRERVNKALEVLKAQAKTAPVDTAKVGAIGFCFGGTTVLELARSGAKVAGVVSFHGGLDSPTPADGKNITARVLALHGADDPFEQPKDLEAFETELRDAKVDWQLVKYGGAVHGFTDVDANLPGKLMYDAKATKRAYQAMNDFFAESFGK